MKYSVLVITHWYFPRNNPRSFRARSLVDELNKRGYSCDVLVGETENIIRCDELDKYYQLCLDNDVESNQLKHGKLSIARKILHFFVGEKFIIFRVKKLLRMINSNLFKYNIVISVGNPFYVHVLAAKIKMKKKCLTIMDCGDPFYLGFPKHSLIVKKIQKNAFKKADYVTIPIVEANTYYLRFVRNEKIKVIPQSFSNCGIKLTPFIENKDEKVKFAYAGAFYEDIRNPLKLLQFLANIDMDFEFDIFTKNSGLVYENVLIKYEKIMENKLVVKPFMPREKCIEELCRYDFLVNIQNSVGIQAPSKLIDYAMTNRPIISVDPNNIDEKAMICFLNRDYRKRCIIDIEKYRAENVAEQFIGLFSKMDRGY